MEIFRLAEGKDRKYVFVVLGLCKDGTRSNDNSHRRYEKKCCFLDSLHKSILVVRSEVS